MQKKLLLLLTISLGAIMANAQTPVLTAFTHSSAATETRSYLYTNISNTTTYNFRFGLDSRPGELNDFWIDSFTVTGADTYSYREIPGFHVKLRRVDNTLVTGVKNLIYADGAVTTGATPDTVKIYCTYDTDMEALYSTNKGLTTGTDNMFNNATGNNNNIERIDMIIPSAISAAPGQEPGFAIFERGNNNAHDPVKAALILALDSLGNPSQYSNIVSVTATNYGTGSLLAGTRNYIVLSQQLPGDTALKYSTQVGNQNIAGTFLLFTDFGVADTTTVYGYSLIPNDFPTIGTPADLVDYTNTTYFPNNTTEASGGGIDLIAISGIVANVLAQEPLPLTYVSFEVHRIEGSKAALTWKTADEENMQYTDIQRSKDGRNWQSIGTEPLHKKTEYTYVDETPLAGMNYYRLGFVDNNNTKYSPVRSINIPRNLSIKITPNPVTGYAAVSLETPLGADGNLQLLNNQGQEVFSEKVPNQQQINIDLRNFQSGHYYLVLKNGNQIQYKEKILKL